MNESVDLRAQLEIQRPYLLRFATLQLRSAAAAEDAVQETLLAALAGEARFSGRSNLRTWLTGILKHKIVDHIRKASREVASGMDDDADAVASDSLFDERGHWHEHPDVWEHPEGALEQKQFLETLEKCLRGLPAKTSRVFMLREHMDLSTEEICKEMGLTSTHCWVLLYRARMALRACLEQSWFGGARASRD